MGGLYVLSSLKSWGRRLGAEEWKSNVRVVPSSPCYGGSRALLASRVAMDDCMQVGRSDREAAAAEVPLFLSLGAFVCTVLQYEGLVGGSSMACFQTAVNVQAAGTTCPRGWIAGGVAGRLLAQSAVMF